MYDNFCKGVSIIVYNQCKMLYSGFCHGNIIILGGCLAKMQITLGGVYGKSRTYFLAAFLEKCG